MISCFASYSVSTEPECETARFLIVAVKISVGISVLTTVVFVLANLLQGRLSNLPSAVVNGMGLFQSMLLLEAGLILGVLARERKRYQDLLDTIEQDNDLDGYKLSMYGGSFIMWGTVALAFGTGGGTLLYVVVVQFCAGGGSNNHNKSGNGVVVHGPDNVRASIAQLEGINESSTTV